MYTEEKNGLKLLRFDCFKGEPGLACAVSTRPGGVSSGPYAGLNLGPGSGDRPEDVVRNLEIFCEAFGAEPARLGRMRQRHTANVAVLEGGGGAPPENTDAIVTAERGLPLLALSADCALTALYDRRRRVIAAVHTGWRGAFLGAHAAALNVMRLRFGTDPADVTAAVSPAISQAHYPVKDDFLEKLKTFFPEDARRFAALKEGAHFFNLRELLRWQFEGLGIGRHEFMHLCTYSEKELFYSWRRDGERTGRFGLAVMLE